MSVENHIDSTAIGESLVRICEAAAKRADGFLRKAETALIRKELNWHLAVQLAVSATPVFTPPARPSGMEVTKDKNRW